jgi:hypothetical protein
MRCILLAVATLAVTLTAPTRCHAAPQEFQGIGTGANTGLRAEAEFSVSGGNLQVKLTNSAIAPFTVDNPAEVLTGVFFDLSGSPALSKSGGSAQIAAGSTWVNFSAPSGFTGNVGGEWAFKSGFGSGLPQFGLGASGLGGTFGPGDTFTNADLSGGSGAGGVDWGLVSSNYNAGDGNGGINNEPLIRNSAIFTLTGLAPDFDLASGTINNVRFQYGTTMTEPSIVGASAPEPGSLTILGLAVAPLVGRRLRRRRAV